MQFVGTSGTITTLAAVHLDLRRYDRRRIDGLVLDRNSISRVSGQLRGMTDAARAAHPCIGQGSGRPRRGRLRDFGGRAAHVAGDRVARCRSRSPRGHPAWPDGTYARGGLVRTRLATGAAARRWSTGGQRRHAGLILGRRRGRTKAGAPGCGSAARVGAPGSTRWLKSRHLNDPYVQSARQAGYRARAAFKLLEIDRRFGVLEPGGTVVDLGSAPGSWAQVAAARGCRVIGLDRLEVAPIPGATLLQGDVFDPETSARLRAAAGG